MQLFGHEARFQSMSNTFRTFVVDQGVASLVRGLDLSLAKIIPEIALKFAVYEEVKKRLVIRHGVQKGKAASFQERFLAGSAAGLVSHVAVYPFGVVQVRLASQKPAFGSEFSGIFDAFVKLYRQHGFFAFYRGMLVRLCIDWLIVFLVYWSTYLIDWSVHSLIYWLSLDRLIGLYIDIFYFGQGSFWLSFVFFVLQVSLTALVPAMGLDFAIYGRLKKAVQAPFSHGRPSSTGLRSLGLRNRVVLRRAYDDLPPPFAHGSHAGQSGIIKFYLSRGFFFKK